LRAPTASSGHFRLGTSGAAALSRLGGGLVLGRGVVAVLTGVAPSAGEFGGRAAGSAATRRSRVAGGGEARQSEEGDGRPGEERSGSSRRLSSGCAPLHGRAL